jgi:hypothetical protein
MAPADHEPTLNDDDTLSLWVGRVARTHALLEYDVDNVHRFLARRAGHASGSKSAKGFDQLVGECRKLLRRSDADQEVVTSGDAALLAAKEATGLRNRVVHDMWLLDPLREDWEPPRWNTFQRLSDVQESYSSPDLQDLTTVVDTHNLLMRTRMRVSGLFMALHETWPAGHAGAETSTETMARNVALMTDRFILHLNGDFDVT